VILANVVSSQIDLHAEYGGVVPELATREHLRNLPRVVAAALEVAEIKPSQIDVFAATRGPGLPAALMAGYTAAQAMAFALDRPILGINHHEAHLYSPWIGGEPVRACFEEFVPNISLIVSGGHTLLVHVKSELNHTVLGGTLDDAAGECFDKVAKLLGLPYPGGPLVDRLAEEGNPEQFVFPRPMINDPNHDFSFSGLKTSVRVFLEKRPGLADSELALRDLCAGLRAAIVDTLVAKTLRAAEETGVDCVTASGGVSCNRLLRRNLEKACQTAGLQLRLTHPDLCTDNAAMIGILAERRWRRGDQSPFDLEVEPNWAL
jgi:N6-L-threonylcarbamoyladenine synthase